MRIASSERKSKREKGLPLSVISRQKNAPKEIAPASFRARGKLITWLFLIIYGNTYILVRNRKKRERERDSKSVRVRDREKCSLVIKGKEKKGRLNNLHEWA